MVERLAFTTINDKVTLLTADRLPPKDIRRWVARRKADVVTAVRVGLLTKVEACRRYSLSVEEFESWERAYDDHGLRGLRVR